MRHILLACLAVTTFGCTKTQSDDSKTDFGFAASTEGENFQNVGILVNTNTPDSVQDLNLINNVIQAPEAGLNYKVYWAQNQSGASALDIIRRRSAEVKGDGTLFLYLGGHNNNVGQIQGTAQAFDLFGFPEVVNAIRQARGGTEGNEIKRVMLLVFGCYSGSWINTIYNVNGAGAFKEIFVMTSSDSYSQSLMSNGSSNFIKVFTDNYNNFRKEASIKNHTLWSIVEILQRSTQYIGSPVQYTSIPTQILYEPLFTDKLAKSRTSAPEGLTKTVAYSGNVYQVDPDRVCKMRMLENSRGDKICSIWNANDFKSGKATVFSWIDPKQNPKNECNMTLFRNTFSVKKYSEIMDHCAGEFEDASVEKPVEVVSADTP